MGAARGSVATPTQAVFAEYRIISAATAASAPRLTAAVQNAQVYVVFEENLLMGSQSL